MKSLFLALSFLASAIAAPASATIITFVGTSQTVENPDTSESETYTVTFNFDSAIAPVGVFNEQTYQGAVVQYQRAYYTNLVSATLSGPRYAMTLNNGGFSSVSTLASNRRFDGNSGFFAGIGADGSDVGYALQLLYYAQPGFATTALPTSLDIAAAFENGFNVTEYFLNEDDPDSPFIDQRTVLNFRFATGGIVPAAATAVPEPATWGMMILGFGMIGAASRSRKVKTTIAYA